MRPRQTFEFRDMFEHFDFEPPAGGVIYQTLDTFIWGAKSGNQKVGRDMIVPPSPVQATFMRAARQSPKTLPTHGWTALAVNSEFILRPERYPNPVPRIFLR